MQKQNLNTFGCFWRNRLEMLEAEATTNYYYYYNAIELIAQLNCIRSLFGLMKRTFLLWIAGLVCSSLIWLLHHFP